MSRHITVLNDGRIFTYGTDNALGYFYEMYSPDNKKIEQADLVFGVVQYTDKEGSLDAGNFDNTGMINALKLYKDSCKEGYSIPIEHIDGILLNKQI